MTIVRVAGTQLNLLDEDHAEELAAALRGALAESTCRQPSMIHTELARSTE